MLSVYLDTDGRRYPRRADYEKQAADLLRRIDTAGLGRGARASVEADRTRVAEFVAKDFERGAVRGLALFACRARRLWEVFFLPASVRPRAVVDRHPHVLRLEALLGRAERFATVVVGRDRARVFTVRLGEIAERTEVLDDVPGKHGQGGWSQANYARHIEELTQRHYRNAAEALRALSRKEGLDHVVLAGTDEVVASFEKTLHPWLAERVAARVSLPSNATAPQVRDATEAVEDVILAERSAEAVARILEDFAAGRAAAVGLGPTLEALQDGRVETLALSDGDPRAGWRCESCARLSLDNEKCDSCGGALGPVADVHEEMVDEALRRRARVVTSETRPLPDGVGALLRF